MSRLTLVTGGTRGIGRAIAVALQKADYKVVANYANNDEKAKQFNLETGIPVYKWDVSNLIKCKENIQKVEQDMDAYIDILINNAGIKRDVMFHKMFQEDWMQVLEHNIFSCFNMCNTIYPEMRKRNFGRIVNISSMNGLVGQIGQTNYSASKAAIIGFTRSLALEAASKGVTVNAIAPGYIETDMIDSIPADVLEKVLTKIPIGRLGLPEEIARGVLFLVSDDASFIVGETLSINGGGYMC